MLILYCKVEINGIINNDILWDFAQRIFVFHMYNASDENRPKVKLLEDKISIDCVAGGVENQV